MSIAPPRASGKPEKPIRLRPSPREGLNIQYKLKDAGRSLSGSGQRIGVTKQAVSRVVCGKIHSRRIESEIARILGKADWNEVVLEARSEVQKKPVDVVRKEMNQANENRRKAAKKSMSDHVSHGMGKTASSQKGRGA